MSEKRCYTVKELQEILGVSRPTIYNLLLLCQDLAQNKMRSSAG